MKTAALLAAFLLVAGSATAASAEAGLRVERAWARPTPPGAKVGVVYLQIRGGAAADRLLSANSPAAATVELHAHAMDGGVASMRALSGIDVPADTVVELKPGGRHLMLIGLKAPFEAGQKLSLKLRFAKSGEKAVTAEVGQAAPDPAAYGAPAATPHAGHAGH